MPVLFVTDSAEFLIGHPAPSPDFSAAGTDPLLGRTTHTRPRRVPATLLATVPAVSGRSTIVVGSAARTGKSPTEWVTTLLHEHFHQWQSSLPDYYARATGLGLARGDTTGQWMLDYPFPYDSVPVQRAVQALGGALGRALSAPTGGPAALVGRLAAERDRLRDLLSPADYRYLEFQLWQEGVPRFVEIAVAEAAGRDEVEYTHLAERLRSTLRKDLEGMSLGRDRRVGFYALGAGLALLLERVRPDWRLAYERHPFALLELLPAGG